MRRILKDSFIFVAVLFGAVAIPLILLKAFFSDFFALLLMTLSSTHDCCLFIRLMS